MANTKLTALTELTAPDQNDILYIVDDPTGTPASRKVKLSSLRKLLDDELMSWGTDADIVALNRSTALTANTALASVLVGTVVGQAVAANSLIVSNVTANGDFAFYGNLGGNSLQWLFYDSSAGLAYLQPDGNRGFFFDEGAPSAQADKIGFGQADIAAGDARFYVQAEAGSAIILGNDRVRFAASTGIIDIAGTTVLSSTATALTASIGLLIADTKSLVVGHTAKITLAGYAAPELQALGTNGADDSQMLLGRWSADTSAGRLNFLKSRNATIGSNTVVVSGDSLGDIFFFGDDGTDFGSLAAYITGKSDGTPGTGDMPGRLEFGTSLDGGETVTERMRISNIGNMQLNAAVAAGSVGGAVRNLILGNGTVTVGSATADLVFLAAIDIAAGDARFAVQAEVGSPIYLGNNTIRIALGSGSLVDTVSLNGSNDLIKVVSSAAYKRDIAPFVDGFGDIYRLDVRRFAWNDRTLTPGELDYGFIAEEVAVASPSLATYGEDGRPSAIHWHRLATKHNLALTDHESRIAGLESENTHLRERIAVLEGR